MLFYPGKQMKKTVPDWRRDAGSRLLPHESFIWCLDAWIRHDLDLVCQVENEAAFRDFAVDYGNVMTGRQFTDQKGFLKRICTR